MRDSVAWSACFVMVAAALGGCVGSTSSEADTTQNASATVDAGSGNQAANEVGTLEGTVIDDEQRPIVGARITIRELDLTALTDAGGKYQFVNVLMGEYQVHAEKLGYESKAVKVKVDAGKSTPLNLVLMPIAVDDSFHHTDRYSTIMECMVQSYAWVSSCSWPYEAVYLTAHKNGVNLTNYGLPPDIQKNKFRHDVQVPFGAVHVVSELEWKAQSALAKKMQIVDCKEYDASEDHCVDEYHGAFKGESPIRGDWKIPKDLRPKDETQKVTYISAVWLLWAENPQEAGLVFEQKFDQYNTLFINAPPPDEWSILKPQ